MKLSDLNENEKELYDTLGAIGANERTLRSYALERYSVLLNTPEVQRRAGHHATSGQLAEAANVALTGAIAEIVVPRDRLVAEAVLCATDSFEGKSVEERKTFLESECSPLRVSENEYRRARERILIRLACHLLRSAGMVSTKSVSATDGQIKPLSEAVRHLNYLGEEAVSLHYAGLANLFMFHAIFFLDKVNLPWENFLLSEEPRRYVLNHYFSCAYADLKRPSTLSALPGSDRQSLRKLLQKLRDSGPFDATRTESIVNDMTETRHLLEDPELDLRWAGWFQRAVCTAKGKEHSEFETIINVAGEIARLIGQHVQYQAPVFGIARATAHKRIALQYPFDEWLPLVNGQSLYSLVELYFDQHSAS